MIKFDVKIGFKEILALGATIPLLYERIRKVKLKYDEKELKLGLRESSRFSGDGIIFSDVAIDQNGTTWRRET